ncbi:hypothetical protein NC315_13525 [Streptomyces sp. G2]|uniref:hypothetical protein n=1 Tax=Streptomyces sp. G2 TaxID=1684471 RepID=UPI00202F4D07|nr:hypothetical protein [Streptomyces sp. G2]MCM1946390.1 hypothetical protein [Streptomyces sp. G2]
MPGIKSSHSLCDHDDTKKDRRLCRTARHHANCEHGDTMGDRLRCTRQQNEAKRGQENE